MPTNGMADANALFAFSQALGRVVDRITPETAKSLLTAIDTRADSLDKLHRYQAVEILTLQIYENLYEICGPEVACVAHSWATSAQEHGRRVWERLHGDTAIDDYWERLHHYPVMPSPDDYPVLVDFVDDVELMGLLRLEAGWTPDLKQIDPDLDLTSTDKSFDL